MKNETLSVRPEVATKQRYAAAAKAPEAALCHEASQKLSAMPDAPTNWHFLSVTFDPEFDTPAVLKSYGERYHYAPAHWSFLTGPPDKIAELARQSDVKFEREGSLFNHNFRTLIISANGKLQTVFPIGGDLSDAILGEMLKAAAVTNLASFVE